MTLNVGQMFGQKSFFSCEPRGQSARSVDYSSLYFINQEKFLEIIKKYP